MSHFELLSGIILLVGSGAALYRSLYGESKAERFTMFFASMAGISAGVPLVVIN